MKIFNIEKGLDLHLNGEATLQVTDYMPDECAVRPGDFKWLVPKLLVGEGDAVQVGTPLFASKEDERLVWTSPVAGVVKRIVRGEKRRLEAVVVERDPQCAVSRAVEPHSHSIIDTLLAFGLWPMVRQRPYGCIADYRKPPKALFVSCFDSAPLAPDFSVLLQGREEDFMGGVRILSQLTDGLLYLCVKPQSERPSWISQDLESEKIRVVGFNGPHPAGNVGTQINCITPMSKGETVWYVHPQDVAVIGRLFARQELCFSKMFALTGPAAPQPRYVRTLAGASLKGCIEQLAHRRLVSGNVLTGHTLQLQDNEVANHFLGYYDHQVTVLPEGGERRLLGWLTPNLKRWSFSHTYLSWLTPKRIFPFDTTLNGGRRVMILNEVYEQVVPLDILPMELLKACVTRDVDKMEELGIYDVIEEDFALCDVVCPSKTECQQIIAEALTLVHNA